MLNTICRDLRMRITDLKNKGIREQGWGIGNPRRVEVIAGGRSGGIKETSLQLSENFSFLLQHLE